MDEVRVQVNRLYESPYNPQIYKVRDLMNDLYPI